MEAWIVLVEQIIPFASAHQTFVGLYNRTINAHSMLFITEHLYDVLVHARNQRQSEVGIQTKKIGHANFCYLNDGSLFEDRIICGSGSSEDSNIQLIVSRAYDVTFSIDSDEHKSINWREPHVLVIDEKREIEYWEELTAVMDKWPSAFRAI